MYIDRSVILINALDPDYIFPQHHGTIAYGEADQYRFWAKGYPDEVKLRLSQPLKDKFFILKPGQRGMKLYTNAARKGAKAQRNTTKYQ